MNTICAVRCSKLITRWLCIFILGVEAYPDGVKTASELRKEAMQEQSSPRRAQGPVGNSELQLSPAGKRSATKPLECPNPVALDVFMHEIAFQRTEQLVPLAGLKTIRTQVWEQGRTTVFYVDDRSPTFPAGVRLVYDFTADGAEGYSTCPVVEDWRDCAMKSIEAHAGQGESHTCTKTINLQAVAPWKPSPNDLTKRRLAEELRTEIETQWPESKQIVVRDFNLNDPQLAIYLKLPDGDYLQGCGFRALAKPHCVGWHSYGQARPSSLRDWIFQLPYRLK